MLKMSQINHIRDMARNGYRISEIAKETGTDAKTVRKYLEIEDFSPEPPIKVKKDSKLDAYKATIIQWLSEDQKTWYKQHHTAKRVHDRLKEEEKCDASYSVVQRFIKEYRAEEVSRANQELIWDPGTAQVDFGEADFLEGGLLVRKKYLTVSFPHSNDSFAQVFDGENAECVCQGLANIFGYIGGVPNLLIFDNATGVGRRMGEEIRETALFSKFRAHYGFGIRFCNPNSGHEKGHVEKKVGYTRANLFVPVPKVDDFEDYNRKLLDAHHIKASEVHYKKGRLIRELFEEDQEALLSLPRLEFNVCRYEWVKADGYGKVCLEGKHYYSTKPEFAHKKVLLGIKAHTIEILEDTGEILKVHQRSYSEKRSDTTDYSTSLATLMKNVGAYPNSGLRRELPSALRDYLDQQPRVMLKDCLKMMNDLNRQYGFEAAVSAMDMAAARGKLNLCDAAVLAARITGYGLHELPQAGPPLEVYDLAFLSGGECIC